VPRDRFDYNTAVSDSWKEQTLLNIVKVRYADMPLFIEVASIVSGYTWERSVNLSATTIDGGTVDGTAALGGSGSYTERPTITYVPITGSAFNKTFMTPVPPSALLFLIQSGWPAEIVLPMTLQAINGMRAQHSATGALQKAGNAGYYRVVELFTHLQSAGALSMRVVPRGDLEESTVLVIRRQNIPAEITAISNELAKLLGVRNDASEYAVVYAENASNDTELAMSTRSILSIMVELSAQVTVPEEHVSEGRTYASLASPAGGGDKRRLIDIRSSQEEPEDAFVSVQYRDHWFWLDDRDFKSKRTFAYLMLLFSLTESGGREGLPLVTIPAG
jgi:hypothetical protein